jgi:putative hydrolase of the HAD superfamily
MVISVDALVFDLDDTLFRERDFVFSGFRAVDRWLKTHRHVGGFATKARELYDRGQRGHIFDQALTELRHEAHPDLIAELVRVYREHKPRLSLPPDARWALSAFRSHWKLGLLTDGYLTTQQNKVAALGLEKSFDVLLYTDSLGREHWKPSERPYRRMMEQLDCSGNQCVYIGDNPAKDFVAANALGWHTIQVVRPDGEYGGIPAEKPYQARQQIHSLFELAHLLTGRIL